MYCFTRKTLVDANRVRIHILGVKQIVKHLSLRVKQLTLRVKTSVLRVKHRINDPFGHKLQITLINVPTL